MANPWYCLNNGSWWDSWIGCDNPANWTAQDQLALMKAGYGANASQQTIDRGTADFSSYLDQTQYDKNISNLRSSDNSLWLFGIIVVGGLILADELLFRR